MRVLPWLALAGLTAAAMQALGSPTVTSLP